MARGSSALAEAEDGGQSPAMTGVTLGQSKRAEGAGELPADTDSEPVVELRVAISARIDLGRVPAAFGDEAPNWLGRPTGQDATGLARYLCDLELRVSPERRAAFRKSTIVSLGTPVRNGHGWVIPIEWRAATLAPLFPVLVGRLVITADRIALDGHYAPPFGVVGYVLDRALLSIAARGIARWFLTKMAGVLGEGT